jgi:hypothetical protein
MARIDETAAPVAEKSVESSASAVEWASIFGGALAALGHGTPVSPEAADQARKIAVGFAFTTSLSLLIGAFVASAAGALGGLHRDEA